MKKEDVQNSQQNTGSAENKGQNRDQQKNLTNANNEQQNDMARQAGLGRDRMTSMEDLGNMIERNDYLGGDNDDLTNENLNAANDR